MAFKLNEEQKNIASLGEGENDSGCTKHINEKVFKTFK